MAKKNEDVRERFIAKIRPFKRIEPVPRMSSVYTTFNEVLLDVRYSGLMAKGNYWFFIDTHRLNQWRDRQRFVECLMCGDEQTVLFLPDEKIFEWYDGIEPNRKGHWFITVVPASDRLMLKIDHGRSDVDGTDYFNRYDLISPIIPRPLSRTTSVTTLQPEYEEIKTAVLNDARLAGDTLHERVVDMLYQLGEWYDYESKKSYCVEQGSPYAIDLVWLKAGEIDVAIEVHDGGNETEAKDRLRQALRFGARKVVVVSNPSSMARLKSICQFEPELKNWLQVWGIRRVYSMYQNGYLFFEDFSLFRRRQRSDEIITFP